MKTYRSARLRGTALIAFFFLLVLQMVQADSATWNLNPTGGDWNTTANWTPNTVPNGPDDVATFDVSNQSSVSLSAITEVESILFQPDASAFTITVSSNLELTVSGAGIQNDSGSTQTFIQSQHGGTLTFTNSASAGQMTKFIQEKAMQTGGEVQFFNVSSAGSGTFTNQGAISEFRSGTVSFYDFSTAGDAIFTNEGQINFNDQSNAGNAVIENKRTNLQQATALVEFSEHSSAGNASFINRSGLVDYSHGGVNFTRFSTADHASFVCEGTAHADGFAPGFVQFHDDSTAANATFTIEGSEFENSSGGYVIFFDRSTADNAVIAVNDGNGLLGGGELDFWDRSTGGTAQFTVSGNGRIDFSQLQGPVMTMGSLAGSGTVNMGTKTLFLGGNNLSTRFSGRMQGSGNANLVKEGSGTFELTGPNTYLGGTTVTAGALIANNTTDSATGPGTVQVNAGTLGGRGIIAGAVTVGTGSGGGAFLAPTFGRNGPSTLTLQSSLTLQGDATYTYSFKARQNRSRSDQVIANRVTINNATIAINGTTIGQIEIGTVLTVISNTSADPISGTFSNLADGAIVNVSGNNFQASYSGGDGNDLTLTVVP